MMPQRQFPPGPGALPAKPTRSATLPAVQMAIEALHAGRWDDAERQAASVLATRPQEPGALNVLGCVALNRNRLDEAIALFERVRAIQSKDPLVHFNLGEAHRRRGDVQAALRHFRKAARLRPEFAEAHAQMGEMLRALGHATEAAEAYQTALSLKPDLPHCLNGFGLLLVGEGKAHRAAVLFEAALRATPVHLMEAQASLWANLGSARLEAGAAVEGLAALSEAAASAPSDTKYWRLLARSLNNVKEVPEGARFRKMLIALLRWHDIDPRLLATAAVAALKHDPQVEALLAGLADDPTHADTVIAAGETTIEALLRDELFVALLSATPIPDLGLEVLLTSIRRGLLMQPGEASGLAQSRGLAFVCALARQCFLNEYVYCTDAEEEAASRSLAASLERGEFEGSPGDWRRVAVLACYVALHRTSVARLDLELAPEPVRTLVREQIQEAAEERALQESLVALRPVRDTVSIAVQSQYEANPYPRWTRCQIGTPLPLRDAVSLILPHVGQDELPATDRPRVLIAGCGTGVQTMNVVQTYANASVLAVDLSRSSLAYGMRKLAQYGIDSVRHVQADILDLADLDDRFDLVESFGVLHHMREPLAGLRVLADLLAPGGLLFLGLYSKIARASVVAARELIAERALAPTPAGVRAGRGAIMTSPERSEFAPLLSPASDFWTLSECRDMIFHVEEHRFTLLEIGSMLESCGLEFLGLELARPFDRARFAAEHREPAAARSLAAWHAFETRHPDTFGDTYRIWAKRAPVDRHEAVRLVHRGRCEAEVAAPTLTGAHRSPPKLGHGGGGWGR